MGISKRQRAWIAAAAAVALFLGLVVMIAPWPIRYTTITLPLPDGFTKFDYLHLNDHGVVAGVLKAFKHGGDRLFRWERDTGLTIMEDPNFVSPPFSYEISILNNRGQMVGAQGFFREHPEGVFQQYWSHFFYDPQAGFRSIGSHREFRYFGAIAVLKDQRIVFKARRTDPDGKYETRNFFWHPESGFQDIPLTGWVTSVNETGDAFLWEDYQTTFLWSPQEGKIPLPPLPDGDIFQGIVDESGGVTGIGRDLKNPNCFLVFHWDRRGGYEWIERFENQTGREYYPIMAFNDRKMLIYEEVKPFDFFGLIKRREKVINFRILTVGEGTRLARGIPNPNEVPGSRWLMNRTGWIVCFDDKTMRVMIPKDQRQTKK